MALDGEDEEDKQQRGFDIEISDGDEASPNAYNLNGPAGVQSCNNTNLGARFNALDTGNAKELS